MLSESNPFKFKENILSLWTRFCALIEIMLFTLNIAKNLLSAYQDITFREFNHALCQLSTNFGLSFYILAKSTD